LNIVQVISWLVIALLLLQLTKNPHKVFWVSLMLFFDPGGFFSGYLNSDIIWRIKYYDVFFALMVLAYFLTPKIRSALVIYNPTARQLIRYLVIVTLYFLIAYGILVPLTEGYLNFPFFIQKNRMYFYALPIFVFVYYFSVVSIGYFYRYIIFFALFILGSYFITLLAGLNIIPIQTWSRYGEDSRMSMISYGLVHWVQPMGLIVLALGQKIKIPYRKVLYLVMVLMVLTIILTLTRREYMRLFFMLLVIPVMASYITKSSFYIKLSRYLIPLVIGLLLINLLFSDYSNYSKLLVRDLYSTITTGADTQGVEEYRITGTGGLETAKDIIRDKWLFGMGYYPVDWGDITEMKKAGDPLGHALDASSEVPIYGALMRLGIVGLIMPFIIYVFLVRLFMKSTQTIKRHFWSINNNPFGIVLFLTALYFLVAHFTIDAYNLFGEFYSPHRFVAFLLILGVFIGISQKIKLSSP
jgi:hypothetical protein